MDNKAIFEILNFFRLKMSFNDILSPIPPRLVNAIGKTIK